MSGNRRLEYRCITKRVGETALGILMFSETHDNIRETALGMLMYSDSGDIVMETRFVITILNCNNNTVTELTLGNGYTLIVVCLYRPYTSA